MKKEKGIGYVKDAREMLDYAFSAARKEAEEAKAKARPLERAKVFTYSKIRVAGEELEKQLVQPLKDVPVIEEMPEFYSELIELRIGMDRLRMAFGQLTGSLKAVRALKEEYLRKALKAKPSEMANLVTQYYGRVSSIVKKDSAAIDVIQKVAIELKSRDKVRFDVPTVVIAGFPNVGKSTLLKGLTKSRVEVAAYPFTTKKLFVGHFSVGPDILGKKIQVIDTPGLLERPLSERNAIEKEALLGLKRLADIVLFVFDVSQGGYPYEDQKKLYDSIKREFRNQFLVIANKADDSSKDKRDSFRKDFPDSMLLAASERKDCDRLASALIERLGQG